MPKQETTGLIDFRIANGPSSTYRFIELGCFTSFRKWFETEGFVVFLLAAIGASSFVFLYRGVAIWKAALVLIVFSITCTWLVQSIKAKKMLGGKVKEFFISL